jgi:hypothetical protein
MTVHEKARAYEALKKDFAKAIESLKKHYEDGLELPNREEYLLEKENSPAFYYAKVCGAMQGFHTGLEWIVKRMSSDLSYYENLK